MSWSVVTLLSNLWPQLHATAEADAVFWTQNEEIRYIADAAKRIVQTYGVRIVRDTTSVTLATGQAVYFGPPRHLSTIHVALDNRALRPTSTTELERKDASYQTRAATATSPVRWWYEDRNIPNYIGLYPVPFADDNNKKLEVIFHQYLCGPHIDLSDPTIDAPLWVSDWLEIMALAESYKRESDFQMPESAQAYDALAALYGQITQSYWDRAE